MSFRMGLGGWDEEPRSYETVSTPSAVIVGIDPGINGAIAAVWQDSQKVFDTPKLSTGTKSEMSEQGAIQLLTQIRQRSLTMVAVLEKVGGMPGQSAPSAFKFGCNYGQWRGILAALGIPYHLVTPQSWKAKMMEGQPKAKEAALLQAQRMFPAMYKSLERKCDLDRAEALLIAEYGRRYLV